MLVLEKFIPKVERERVNNGNRQVGDALKFFVGACLWGNFTDFRNYDDDDVSRYLLHGNTMFDVSQEEMRDQTRQWGTEKEKERGHQRFSKFKTVTLEGFIQFFSFFKKKLFFYYCCHFSDIFELNYFRIPRHTWAPSDLYMKETKIRL